MLDLPSNLPEAMAASASSPQDHWNCSFRHGRKKRTSSDFSAPAELG